MAVTNGDAKYLNCVVFSFLFFLSFSINNIVANYFIQCGTFFFFFFFFQCGTFILLFFFFNVVLKSEIMDLFCKYSLL